MSATVTSKPFGLAVFVLLAIFLIAVPSAEAGQFSYSVEYSPGDLAFGKLAGFDVVSMGQSGYLNEVGKPRLPLVELRLALPSGLRAEMVTVTGLNTMSLDGDYRVFPAQPPLRISEAADDLQFVAPDPAVYGSSQGYPADQVRLIGQADLAGQSFAIIEICPLQYAAATGQLTLATSLTITVQGADNYVCGDYLPANISPRGASVYRRQLSEMVVNSSDVALVATSQPLLKSRMLPPGGPFDHVIITTSSLASYWSELVEWHNQKGVRDTVITVDYIYANYSGTSNQAKIQAFVSDAHDNWGTIYVLIGGEHSQVPFQYRTYEGESIPGDQLYSDLDGDWQQEVFVGRVTADNQTQIERFIDKLLTYELGPPVLGYLLNATVLGMDLTTQFDPPYYTLTAGEEMKEFIDTSYIPSRFNVTKIYDSDLDNHYSAFVTALNDGQNLVNHCDHSNTTVMGCGDRNHGWAIYNNTVDGLTNENRLSVIYSLGCHPNEMDYNDCIAEHFVVYNDLKGAVAFTGHTRSGWFYVGDPHSLSNQLDEIWWEGLFDQNQYRAGEALAYTKNNCPTNDGYWRYCHWTLNLLGEPEMPIWTDTPTLLQAAHVDSITEIPTAFTVNVFRHHGVTIDSAYVCLWKAGDLYAVGYTDSDGNVSFDISPSSGDLHVTATKQNCIPYRGLVGVEVQNQAPQCQVPNDTAMQVRGDTEICLPVGCFDPDGNLAGGPTLVSGPGEIADGYWCFVPTVSETVAVTVRCEDTGGLFCESSYEVEIDIFYCGDADSNGLINVSDAVYLIGFIFGSQIAPDPEEAGDADCSQIVNISDVVYLINFIFGGGPDPCADC